MIKQYLKIFLLFFLIIIQSSCQTQTLRMSIEVSDYVTPRKNEYFLEPQERSDSPEKALSSMEHLYYKNDEEAFQQLIAYGNYFLKTWYKMDLTAQIANRMAWSILFLIDEDYTTFKDYEENIYNFCRALFYINNSMKYDQTSDYYWNNRGADLKLILTAGYKDLLIMSDYLRAKRLVSIDLPTKQDIHVLQESIHILQDIHTRYPAWLPSIVETDLIEQLTFLDRLTK